MEISCLRALDKLTTPKQYQEISKPWLSVLISSSFDVNQNHRISNLLNSISNSSESLEYLVASVSEIISDLNEEEISKLSNLLKTINKNKDDSLIDIYNEMKSFVELQRLPETSFLENQIQNIQKYVEFYSNFINSIVNNDPIDTMLFISSQLYSFSEIFENSKINLMKINIKTMISKIIGVNADIQIIITAIKAVVSLLNENSNNKYEFLSSKVNRLEKSVFTDYITGSVYDFVSKLPKFDILNQDFDFSYIRDTFVRESIKQECSKYKDNPNLRTSLSFNLSSKVLSINTPEITELSYTFVLLELSEGLAKRLNIPFNFSQKNFEKSFVIDKKPELLQDQTVVHEEPIHFQFANEKRKAPKFDFQIDPLDDREFNIQNESLMINDAFGENAERITDIIHFVENNF
ncbi:hypothetical protein TVAG_166250 [Trichomonas vaginalis G3]|uniref:Uncharacterized protein n=1 Tax=Trichomonas vaginalis (strain ATCC PRA-98 / G3) TaxID=412133 RepID=A2DE32_TRIV3|nr:hypothetical protein TVAGG3_0174160 [Trichomonas vaginalis G3]EAY21250.1 hypothetical protein TVAG_166250 [Trichomonas vaginalis G3]KAI5548810.1 hypothetical protein TVAGG3_0174160 [Trichomonas vaginalis G3]|eukprot:XP_001582236.1 hypothetical protein [Trichomonas vaginalis G3]